MTPQELRDYAEALILDHAQDVEYLSVHEMAPQCIGHDIDGVDARAVHDMIGKATVMVSWPDEAHVIDLRDDGWVIKHPLSCRPNLFNCPVNRATGVPTGSSMPTSGQWECGVDARGALTIGRKIDESTAEESQQ
jgi:hypothetical protein